MLLKTTNALTNNHKKSWGGGAAEIVKSTVYLTISGLTEHSENKIHWSPHNVKGTFVRISEGFSRAIGKIFDTLQKNYTAKDYGKTT